MSFIVPQRSIIPACDVPFDVYERLIAETHDIPQIGAYKIGAALALSVGLPAVVAATREKTQKPLIYDHQKAGTDIPTTSTFYMDTLKDAGIDATILFPLAGSRTQSEWTAAARASELRVIVGGHMTHEGFLHSQGGYIADDSVATIYERATADSVTDFVVPGNKPEVIERIRGLITDRGVDAVYYAPGFISQGGDISEAAKVAGPRWHAIVGTALFQNLREQNGIRNAALRLAQNL